MESVWENGRTRQKVIRYIGKEVDGKPVRRVQSSSIKVQAVRKHLDIEIVHRIAGDLGLTGLRKEILILVYSQLLDRPSINRLEEWLGDTDMLEILGTNSTSTSRLYDALDALDILGRGYRIQLKDQESGLEWSAEVELSKKQEEIRNLVYKT